MSGIHSVTNSELVSCTMPPMVGGDDSIVVGIFWWSPVSGERVGQSVQGESVSEGQGTSYSCTCHSALHRTTYVHRQTFCVGVLFIPQNNGIHLVPSKTEFIDST